MTTRDKINALRAQLGWSMNRLAIESGVPKSSVHDYLTGLRDIGTASADQMISTLEKYSEKSDNTP